MHELILSKAISALSKGRVIVYPTDTLYGLGADIFNKEAVKQVFKIKNRPLSLPISIAVSKHSIAESGNVISQVLLNFNLLSSFILFLFFLFFLFI